MVFVLCCDLAIDDVIPTLKSEMKKQNVDLLIQSDARASKPETHDWVCAGFIYAVTSPRTVALFREVERVMDETGGPDQDVLQLLLTGHSQWYVLSILFSGVWVLKEKKLRTKEMI